MVNMMTDHTRNSVPWSEDIWSRIDQAVHDECKRTKVAAKFLPIFGPIDSSQLTMPSDTIVVNQANNNGNNQQKLAVREAATVELVRALLL